MEATEKGIVISSKPESLVQVEEYIEYVRKETNIGDDVYGNMLISVTEAVNNAIIHGNKNDENKKVRVKHTLSETPKVVSFIISDEGKGFDYNNLPDPTAPENITMLGGRGVFLIKQLADWVVFSDEGSTIEIQFKI